MNFDGFSGFREVWETAVSAESALVVDLVDCGGTGCWGTPLLNFEANRVQSWVDKFSSRSLLKESMILVKASACSLGV